MHHAACITQHASALASAICFINLFTAFHQNINIGTPVIAWCYVLRYSGWRFGFKSASKNEVGLTGTSSPWRQLASSSRSSQAPGKSARPWRQLWPFYHLLCEATHFVLAKPCNYITLHWGPKKLFPTQRHGRELFSILNTPANWLLLL